jgi:hypothetical protein
MTVHHYRHRPTEITALKWTGDNTAEMREFVGADGHGNSNFLSPAETQGLARVYIGLDEWRALTIGQYVAKDAWGCVKTIHVDLLAEAYEPADVTCQDACVAAMAGVL